MLTFSFYGLALFTSTLGASEALERLAANELVAPSDQAAGAIDLGEGADRRLSVPPARQCWTGSDCGPGYGCSNCCGFCVLNGGGWVGARCAHYSHCSGSLQCRAPDGSVGTKWNEGTCQHQKKSNGYSCNWDSECHSDFCYSGICQTKKFNGSQCRENIECYSRWCEKQFTTSVWGTCQRDEATAHLIRDAPDAGGRRRAEEATF